MTKQQALGFVDERLKTMQYEGIGSKETFKECIEFLEYAKKAIENMEEQHE